MLTNDEHNERVALIRHMRANGKTYREIGDALGITRQAAHYYTHRCGILEPRERSITRNTETVDQELERLHRKRQRREPE